MSALAASVAAAIALGANPAECDPGAANCESATGRIVYVERVDPDGDGDAHFVLVGRGGVTAPDLSVIDVERPMRPDPLPRPGDLVSAAGPVYTGSYGQRQIQATELRVARISRSSP
ncbi:MAG: hypothetical protein ACJ75R_06230 [Solirubrobacterales bacterium]